MNDRQPVLPKTKDHSQERVEESGFSPTCLTPCDIVFMTWLRGQ